MSKTNCTQQGDEHLQMRTAASLWRVVEISLESTETYANPYADTEVTACFLGPGGETIHRPAFWDGGRIWKLRFAPPTPGVWRWSSACTHPQDGGLHGRSGELRAAAVETGIPLHRHGFLRISPSGRHFVHADGTPFFWLGDTHWVDPRTGNETSVAACLRPEADGTWQAPAKPKGDWLLRVKVEASCGKYRRGQSPDIP